MVQVRLSEPARFLVVASPAYLSREGTPEKPEDLLAHDSIGIRGSTSGERYAWELERGKKTWRAGEGAGHDHGRGADAFGEAGLGLVYTFEPLVAAELKRRTLRVVLERYAPVVPGLFLYFASRAQVSPAVRAFVDVAREWAAGGRSN